MRIPPVAARSPAHRPCAALLLNLSLLLGVSCDEARPPQRPVASSATHAAGPPSSPSRFQLRVGDTLRVRLDASPATGYAWNLEGPLPSPLRMESDPGVFAIDAGRLRAMKAQTWTFRAQHRGRVLLRFLYGRAWEPSSFAAGRRDIEVEVE